MIWKIAKKEFLLNLMTFKFAVGAVVCVVLTAVFMPVLVSDYQRSLKDYNDKVARNEAELWKVKVYMNITPTVYRPPNVLSVFSEGLEKQLGQSAKIELGGVSEISAASTGGNPFLSIFPTLDVTLILKVVVSILALLVAYDTVSGEREQGTLKLILSGRVARHHVLIGKLLAGLVTLIILVTIAFVMALLMLQFFPMVSLAEADWIRIGLMYLASLIFISAMYSISLLFSCMMRRSSISLVLGLLVWIIFAVVIPNGSVCLANYLRPTEGREKMDVQVSRLMQERDNTISELTRTINTSGIKVGRYGAFGNWFLFFGDQRVLANSRKEYALSEPVKIRYADRIFEVQQQYLGGLMKQRHLAGSMARISPVTIYQSLMSALAGTDLRGLEHFRNQVKLHTDEVVEYIRSRTENFSAISYFTPTRKEDILKMVEETERMMALAKNYADVQFGWKEFEKWVDEKLKQTPSLDLQDVPRFTYGRESLAGTLQRIIPHVASLFFVNVLFLTLSFVAFLKYDVR
jgi:ABC-type transport system involved in multi-copper enzyme maturation permease subunit